MLKLLISLFLFQQITADLVTYLDYGGKIPQNGLFDVRFNYDADGSRDCEVALKNPGENWKTYAYTKIQCGAGKGAVKAVTLSYIVAPALGFGYLIEVKILNNGVQTAYYKIDVAVQSGKQGFHIYNGKLYDANSNEFLIRGINNANADYDNYNRWWGLKALLEISETGANTVRILWRKYSALTSSDLDKVIDEAIKKKLVPIIEMHDATGSSDNNKLYEMAQWLADNVWLLIKYRKYLLVNIANEWSPHGTSETFWRDSYKYAISIIRKAGYSGTLVVDASAYAQNPNGPKLYGNELINTDSAYNLLFSVHMYAEWSYEQPNYNIASELQQIKDKNIPFIVGEFANKHPARINGNCVHATIDAKKIMTECQKHRFGYLG